MDRKFNPSQHQLDFDGSQAEQRAKLLLAKQEENTVCTGELSAVSCKCKSQFCGECSLGAAVRWRERLRPVAREFKSALMITFTIDPKGFKTPEQAWQFVGSNRKLSETVRELDRLKFLHSRRYFWALEFHKKAPHWPHWHMVIDASYVPHDRLLKSATRS
ncbi:MAG: hypothetical protein AAFN77_16825 [Planctomycetota bacterium]